MTNMVPYIMEYEHPGSYGLVIAILCLDLLSDKFPDFELLVDYTPSKPAEEDIRMLTKWPHFDQVT